MVDGELSAHSRARYSAARRTGGGTAVGSRARARPSASRSRLVAADRRSSSRLVRHMARFRNRIAAARHVEASVRQPAGFTPRAFSCAPMVPLLSIFTTFLKLYFRAVEPDGAANGVRRMSDDECECSDKKAAFERGEYGQWWHFFVLALDSDEIQVVQGAGSGGTRRRIRHVGSRRPRHPSPVGLGIGGGARGRPGS